MLFTSKMLSNCMDSEKRFKSSNSTASRGIVDTDKPKPNPVVDTQHLLDVLAHRNVSFGAFINDKERVLAENDLMPINYFAKGLTISKAVGRVNIFDVAGKALGFGTGFLIGNNILLTNNHVLTTKEDAINSFIEFEYEMDENNRPKSSVLFGLDPNKLYITDEALDFTVVYVKQQSESGGKPIRLWVYSYYRSVGQNQGRRCRVYYSTPQWRAEKYCSAQ
jgi:hypothetical protein